MTEKYVAYLAYKANGSLCGKILSGDGECQTHKSQQNKYQAHFDDVACIAVFDTRIDYGSDDQRDKQLEKRFKQFEKRA